MNYYLQTQTPASNWVDSIGSDDFESLKSHADYLRKLGQNVRIVVRTDTVVAE